MNKQGKKIRNNIILFAAAVILGLSFITSVDDAVFSSVALDQEARCGMEEHQHTDDCYNGSILGCGKEIHTHSSSCYMLLLEENDVNKILEKIDEIEYEGKTLNMVYSEYKFEVIEDYMDILETNEIVISYMGTQLPSGIEMNEEYILYLIQNKSTDYESDNIFSFVSLLQGIYKYDNGWRNDIGDEFNTKLLRSE